MTENQHKFFYLPHWLGAARAQGWNCIAAIQAFRVRLSETGRCDETDVLLAEINAYADQLAAREHRGVKADDYRHACHIRALGKKIAFQEVNALREAMPLGIALGHFQRLGTDIRRYDDSRLVLVVVAIDLHQLERTADFFQQHVRGHAGQPKPMSITPFPP